MRLGLARHPFWAVAVKFFLLFIVALAALAQGENPPFQAPAGVEIRPDVVYARHGARQMHLDLYLPKEGAGPFPAVVYIHGGGWSGGNKNAFRRQASHMATKGFVGAYVEYRLSGEAKWPAAFDDAKAALAYVRQHAAELKVDPKRIGAAGGSAGGHLVGLLGTMPNPVRAVAAFNPAVDLVSFAKSTPTNAIDAVVKFLGATYQEKPDLWAEASPITHAGQKSAAFLFLHGEPLRSLTNSSPSVC